MNNDIAIRESLTPASPVQSAGALTKVAASREMMEAQAAIQMARTFPRDIATVENAVAQMCRRKTLAEKATYVYSRGGTDVSGPSIRLAEALAQVWGNLSFGVREIEQGPMESTCEAFAWDMETNVRQVKIFHVPHIRHTKNGDKMLTDPRDIYEMVANNGARRLRACILGVIPGDVVDAAVEACERTLKADVENSSDAVERMVAAFEKIGVTRQQLEAFLQRNLDAVKPAQVMRLRQIYQAIADGVAKPDQWFAAEGVVKEQPKAKKGKPTLAEVVADKPAEAVTEKPAETTVEDLL